MYNLFDFPYVLYFIGIALSRVVDNLTRLSMARYAIPDGDGPMARKKFLRLTPTQRSVRATMAFSFVCLFPIFFCLCVSLFCILSH
jgi:hypothetical protein